MPWTGRIWRAARTLLSFSGSAALTLAATTTQAADCRLTQAEIPVRIIDQRPVATLKLNGTELPMLVDSGAFFSMLSASTAAQLNLPLRSLPFGFRVQGYTGRIDVMRTHVDKVTLLGAELRDVEFLVGGNELNAGIMGVLGRNFLSMADTEYDLAHGVVRLSFPKGDCAKTSLAHWAGNAPVVLVPLEEEHREDTAIRVEVSINGKRTLALLDTGAPHTALTLRAARRAGIEEHDLSPRGRAGGAGQGRVKSWTGPVATFELGGQKIANSRLRIDDTDAGAQGMLLGLDYFLSHRIYVSRLQRQVYLTWNGGAVFADNRAAAAEHDTRYAALPAPLANDNADALARRGTAAIASRQFQRALEDLNRACELAPGVAEHFYDRARAHLGMDQPQLALADLGEALRLNPAMTEARLRRAFVRAGLGDHAAAQADLEQLDAALPPSSALRADMAQLHLRFKQPAQALRQLDLWIGTHPKDEGLASALNSRCWLRARLNIELPLALQDCKNAVDKDGGEAAYHDSLGWTYLRLGDAARAKKAFDSAIKLKALPFSLYGRGLANLLLKDVASGESDLAAARKLKPLIDEEVRQEGFEFADGLGQAPAPGS